MCVSGCALAVVDRSLSLNSLSLALQHPVSNDRIQDVYGEWRDFMIRLHGEAATADFAPEATAAAAAAVGSGGIANLAQKYYRELQTQAGYFPMKAAETAKGATVRDLKHYYQCYFPSHGRYPSEVSDGAFQLWSELVSLGKTLVQWIDDHMPAKVRGMGHV